MRKASGSAPIAARSERLTRSILRAMSDGGSPARKCTPAISASAVATNRQPARTSISAASSPRSRAPGYFAASGRKYRAMSSNSPGRDGSPLTRHPHLARTQQARQLVENPIDESSLLAGEERVGKLDIFAHGDPGGNLVMCRQLVDPGPQDGSQDIVEPLDRPVLGQHRRHQIVELAAVRGDAAHQLTEPRA